MRGYGRPRVRARRRSRTELPAHLQEEHIGPSQRVGTGWSPAVRALWRTLRDRHGVLMHTFLPETEAQASRNTRWKGGLVARMVGAALLDGGRPVPIACGWNRLTQRP